MLLTTIVPALLAAAAPSATDRSALESQVVEVFRPYAAAPGGFSAWDLPIYSQELTALIAQWRGGVPTDRPDALGDGDWLCQCQEWDAQGFGATITSIEMAEADVAHVETTLDLGSGRPEDSRRERLIFRREGEQWKLDDIVAESFPEGLKQALRASIASNAGQATGERG